MHCAFPCLWWVCIIANYSASVAGVLNEPDKLICTSIEDKEPNPEIIATCLNLKNIVHIKASVKELKYAVPHS